MITGWKTFPKIAFQWSTLDILCLIWSNIQYKISNTLGVIKCKLPPSKASVTFSYQLNGLVPVFSVCRISLMEKDLSKCWVRCYHLLMSGRIWVVISQIIDPLNKSVQHKMPIVTWMQLFVKLQKHVRLIIS